MPRDIIDFSAYGKTRQKFKLPNGETYEMLDPIEVGAARMARLSRLGEQSSTLEMEDPEQAQVIEDNTREMVQLVMPDVPSDVLEETPFEVIAALAAFFAQEKAKMERPIDKLDLTFLRESNDSTEQAQSNG